MDNRYDLIIIGAGPAGMSAAVYASRAGLKTLILDGGAPGGKLNLTAEIENYPGSKNASGPELAYEMFEQATQFGAVYEYGLVQDIKEGDDCRIIVTDQGELETKAVIIATGTKERKMNIPNEEEMIGRGVSYCAVCDGAFFSGEEVAVVGGGNSALEEALYLTKFADKVHLIVRRDVFRADQLVQQRVLEEDKIEVHFLKKPHSIDVDTEHNKVKGIILEDSQTGELSELAVAAVFPFVGADPVTDFAKNLGILDEAGYVITNEKMATSYPNVYAAGDVRQKFLRQVATAVGDGAIAAQAIDHDIFN